MIAPNPALEVVYESEPDFGGVLGLWSLPMLPGAAADALLVLSFASGSRALSTGVLIPKTQILNPEL